MKESRWLNQFTERFEWLIFHIPPDICIFGRGSLLTQINLSSVKFLDDLSKRRKKKINQTLTGKARGGEMNLSFVQPSQFQVWSYSGLTKFLNMPRLITVVLMQQYNCRWKCMHTHVCICVYLCMCKGKKFDRDNTSKLLVDCDLATTDAWWWLKIILAFTGKVLSMK